MLLGSGFPVSVASTVRRDHYLVVYWVFPECYQPVLAARVRR